MLRGTCPVPLAPHPSPELLERLAQVETWRRGRAHRRSEMRRPLSERRLERTKEAVVIWRYAKSLARELMREARENEKHVRFVKRGVRDFERQEVRIIRNLK